MTPEELDVLASAYLDGELSQQERDALKGDPALAAAIQQRVHQFQLISDSLNGPGYEVPPASAQQRERHLTKALADFSGSPPLAPRPLEADGPRRVWRREWFALAAGVALLLIGAATLRTLAPGETTDIAASAVEPADEATPTADAAETLIVESDDTGLDLPQASSGQAASDNLTEAPANATDATSDNLTDNASDNTADGQITDATSDGEEASPGEDELLTDRSASSLSAESGRQADTHGARKPLILMPFIDPPLVTYTKATGVRLDNPPPATRAQLVELANSPDIAWADSDGAACTGAVEAEPVAYAPLLHGGDRFELHIARLDGQLHAILFAPDCVRSTTTAP